MSYNPDAMTVIVSGDLAPEMMEKLTNQLTADVLTSKEYAERERALAMQETVEADTKENRQEAGLEPDDGFAAPDESEVDNVDMTDTSDPDEFTTDDTADTDTPPEAEEGTEGDDTANESTDDAGADAEQLDDPEDLEEVSEEDAAVKDDLNEPNAAFEHANSIGSKEVGRLLRIGTAKYRRRVRRQRNELKLAHETLQLDVAQRQNLLRRLLYVKPADSGFTSKLQTFISTIDDPDNWIALIDSEGVTDVEHTMAKQQIENALERVGVDYFDNVETLADTFNQVQRAVTEPAKDSTQDDTF